MNLQLVITVIAILLMALSGWLAFNALWPAAIYFLLLGVVVSKLGKGEM